MENSKKFLCILSFILLILFIILSFIYLVSLSPYDELWNFQNIYKMYNGLELYKDANVIITPIFYILGLFFLKTLGPTIISFRILNIILYSILFVLIYFIFKYLKVSKHLNMIFLSLIVTQFFQVINCGANYNALSIIFMLLGMLLYFRGENNKYFHFLQGIIIFLTFFSKQNLGAYYAIAILAYDFLYKKDFKTYFINQLKKSFTFILLLSISLYILYLNNILFDFINYAFGGISDFATTNFTISASPYLIFICIITILFYFFFIFNKKIFNEKVFSNENRKNLNLMAFVAIATTFSVFPILNTAHFIFIMPFYFMILFYFFDVTILEDFLSSKKSISISYFLSFAILLFILLRILFCHFVEEKNFIKIENPSSPFYNVFISQKNYNKIDTMTNYIKTQKSNGIDVIILSYDSALTMVNLSKNNGNFDLVFNGNLGYNGETKMIEKIKNLENTEFLILTDKKNCFWQESQVIREFILENLNKKGEILHYSIYEYQN